MIERDLSDPDGIIIVRGSGVWTLAEVDAHYDALRHVIEVRRSAGEPIRILSDITQAERQAPDIEERILWHIDRTFKDGDRVAMLVGDIGLKQYVRAKLGKADIATFSSKLPAEMWLMYDGLKRPG